MAALGIRSVLQTAPPDLVRLVRLGLATCQRESDLIRMGPEHREGHGIWCRPKKTRKKRKALNIPLTPSDALMLDRWAETPMTFKASRWNAPIERHCAAVYLYSPFGRAFTTSSLQQRWQRWLKGTTAGKELCDRCKTWVADMVRKYEWDIDPNESTNPTIHGLRGLGFWSAAPRATTSIRSPTTLACRVRWSSATCAFATRWRWRRLAESG